MVRPSCRAGRAAVAWRGCRTWRSGELLQADETGPLRFSLASRKDRSGFDSLQQVDFRWKLLILELFRQSMRP